MSDNVEKRVLYIYIYIYIYIYAIYSETRKCKLSFARRSLGPPEFPHQYTHMPAGVSVLFSILESGGSLFIRRNQGMCGGFGMLRIFKIVKYLKNSNV